MKKSFTNTDIGKLVSQTDRILCHIKLLTAAAESANGMDEDELDGLAVSLGHAIDEIDALKHTLSLLREEPNTKIAPFPATFTNTDHGNGLPARVQQLA